ncbi:MAG: FHA domain-containing protein, partial [Chloroflexi bacterium]|nr:FHA domain-containing protein [Chloroflexota bacterium]
MKLIGDSEHLLDADELTIGRSADASITIDDESLADLHATIKKEDDKFVLLPTPEGLE